MFAHVPGDAVRVWPSLAVPAIVGAAEFCGLNASATTSVGPETAVAEPSWFLAVTATRIRRPASSWTSL